MNAGWKVVRVFISSTFRDMQAERDHLVRFVFPKLREELLGRMFDRWEKDGQKHSKLKVVGERLQMLGGKAGGGGGGGRSSGGGESSGSYDESEQYSPAGGPPPNEDIPF